MIKGKMAGIAFGGLAGFLLLNRIFTTLDGAVKNFCTASMWKNYYKYGKDGKMVAPGYSMHTHEDEDGNEVVVEDESQTKKTDPNQKPQEGSIADSVSKAITDLFGNKDKKKEASEGEEKAAEEEDIQNNELEDPFYQDSLENGVELASGDTYSGDIFEEPTINTLSSEE